MNICLEIWKRILTQKLFLDWEYEERINLESLKFYIEEGRIGRDENEPKRKDCISKRTNNRNFFFFLVALKICVFVGFFF